MPATFHATKAEACGGGLCHSERGEESRPGLWMKGSEQDSSLRSE
jgi:hypothetical protein